MKRYMRWMAALVVLLLCVSLCGCAELKDMKAHHAVWLKDGSILWDGVEYKPILDNKYRTQNEKYGDHSNYDLNHDRFDDYLNVTMSDVPVLLSQTYGRRLVLDAKGGFIHGYSVPLKGTYLFCRADQYDEVATQLSSESEEFGYCYDYYAYGSHYDENGVYVSNRQVYYLNAEQEYALSNILDTELYTVYDYDYNADFEVMLYRHDALDLYREFAMRLAYSNGKYYIVMGEMVYEVRADYERTMQDILQAGYDAYTQREPEWYE